VLSARSILLCLAAAAAVFAGCGGDGGQAAAVTETIVTVASTEDPADCERLHTLRFMEQTYGLEGEAAVAACEVRAVDPRSEAAESVTVTKIEIDGSEARANAAFVGSDFDGQTLTIGLVEEDGGWKIDDLIRFVHFDRDRLLDAMVEEMTELAEAAGDPALPACILAWFEARDDEELEAIVVEPDPAALLSVFEDCARRTGADQSA